MGSQDDRNFTCAERGGVHAWVLAATHLSAAVRCCCSEKTMVDPEIMQEFEFSFQVPSVHCNSSERRCGERGCSEPTWLILCNFLREHEQRPL